MNVVDSINTLEQKIKQEELVSLEKSMKYTFADAIREGASVTAPLVGDFSDGKRACAIMAAWIAVKARHMI